MNERREEESLSLVVAKRNLDISRNQIHFLNFFSIILALNQSYDSEGRGF